MFPLVLFQFKNCTSCRSNLCAIKIIPEILLAFLPENVTLYRVKLVTSISSSYYKDSSKVQSCKINSGYFILWDDYSLVKLSDIYLLQSYKDRDRYIKERKRDKGPFILL